MERDIVRLVVEGLSNQEIAERLSYSKHTINAYLTRIFGPFDFAGAAPKAPTETFSGRTQVKVGDKTVDLYEVGPAHTAGDVIAHSVEDGVVFSGDILFIDGTPVMWAGPVQEAEKKCLMMADRLVETPPSAKEEFHPGRYRWRSWSQRSRR